MQQIQSVPLCPPDYARSDFQDQIVAPSQCPQCLDNHGLHRHGRYLRSVSWCLRIVSIWVARFLCRRCRRTVSRLPDWALSYRLVNAQTTQRFLDGERTDPEIAHWRAILHSYEKDLDAFAPQLIRTVHTGLGMPPPLPTEPPWPWIKKACVTLQSATRQLISQFRITLFGRYRCHQPCGFDRPRSAGMTGG